MSRKKEMSVADGLAVEAAAEVVAEVFREDLSQQEEIGSMEDMDSEMESGGEEPEDMDDNADSPAEDAQAEYMEDENALMESAEGGMYEEQPGGFREELDMAGEDIYIPGEDGESAMMEEANALAESAIEPEDALAEAAAEEPAPAKPKRSPRKKKMVPAKEEDEAEAIREKGDREGQHQNGPEGELLAEEPLPTGQNASGLPESYLAADSDYSDNMAIDPAEPEDADRWDGELGENEEEITEGTVDEFIGEAADVALSVAEREDLPSPVSEKRPVDPAPRRTASGKRAEAPVLTLEARGEVETEESREDVVWHEIHNAYRTRRLLTGQLGGIEQTDNGKTIAIVDYKGFRIVIPLKEMMINVGRSPSGQEYAELMLRQNKILGNMLGAEIDFIVKGIDSKARSVVASRRDAMLKKRQIFYLDTDASGMYRVHEGRIVQARVIAVAEKVLRVEVFGVECPIMARDLAWDWIGDAHERFSVGDQVLVRVLSVRRDSLEEIGVKADIKSVSQNTSHDNLKKCRIQSKYAGKVTDVHKGVVYIRLSNGVNAVAHSCFDYRTPGKKDDVSFAVTRLDEERGVAVGIITRVIRRNL